MKHLILFLFLIPGGIVTAQNISVSGYVTDAAAGESLIGANVSVVGTSIGVITNNYGFYAISVPAGNQTIRISYVGFETVDSVLNLTKSISLNVKLTEKSTALNEVVISAGSNREKLTKSNIGVETLSMKSISKLPVIFGESDILKVIQLMPGVQPAGEGSSGFNVRGGNYDQNLILLDEAVVYNPGHIFSFISVFNDDAINNITLHKGTMTADYGGRTSSVLDISMKEGNNNRFSGKGSVGLIASKLTLEGPINSGKLSYLVSARRSVIDLFAKPLVKIHGGNMQNDNYYFYDLNAKINYRFSERDRLFFSNYYGKDVFDFGTEDSRFSFHIPWGNLTSTLRWNHLFSDKLFLNVAFVHNGFFRDMSSNQDGFVESRNSKITDETLKADITWYSPLNHKFKFGIQATDHLFKTESITPDKKRSIEAAAYLLDEFNLGKNVNINLGIRLNTFAFVGAYTEYAYNANNEAVSVIKTYDYYETVATYNSLEPRLNVRFLLNEKSSLKIAFTRNSQFMHLISNSGSALPLDIWVPSTKLVKPQYSNQFTIGYNRLLANEKMVLSVEAYGKNLENLIEFSDEFVPSYINSSERDYVFGTGNSHGFEVSLKKNTGKLQGWIGYTFSNTTRKFAKLNYGEEFPANTDVRNDFSLVGTYAFSQKWTLGWDFVFKSGKPFTVPTGRYYMDGELVDHYTTRNNVRLPAYHRLDISATYTPRPDSKKFNSQWVFAIYNVYNRLNTSFVYFDNQGTTAENTFVTRPKSVTLLPFMPSVTYKFSF